MSNMIVTGGYGFIGSNFIRYMLAKHPDLHIYNIDKLSYAANHGNFDSMPVKDAVRHITGYHYDLSIEWITPVVQRMVENLRPEWVVHFAAESHVDNSIEAPRTFLRDNVTGTLNLLEALRHSSHKAKLFHISTDEVYGSLSLSTDPEIKQSFMEHDQFEPSSPYAASKAAAEMFVHSYGKTFNVPYVMSRCSNNYGPNQFVEKFIPKVITNAFQDKKIPVYGQGINRRDWIHVSDNCAAIEHIMKYGMIGEAYNIGTEETYSNLEIVQHILNVLGKPYDLINHVTDRLGHDMKYQNDCFKLTELGWKPVTNLWDGLLTTIHWYENNEWFWK